MVQTTALVFMKNGRVLNYLLHETVRLTDPIEKEKYGLVYMYTTADNQEVYICLHFLKILLYYQFIDCVQGHHKFCLAQELNCCLKPLGQKTKLLVTDFFKTLFVQ